MVSTAGSACTLSTLAVGSRPDLLGFGTLERGAQVVPMSVNPAIGQQSDRFAEAVAEMGWLDICPCEA